MRIVLSFVLSLSFVVLAGCGDKPADAPAAGAGPDLGLQEGLTATVVAKGLMNPSGLAFDAEGGLLVCDSGHGRVVRVHEGVTSDHITGFDTEYWKVDPETGTKRFKLGPLSVVTLPDGRLVVSDGGKKDGAETLLFFQGAGTAADGVKTNAVGPTSEDEADKGEGNLTGMTPSRDGARIFVAGQGSDAGTWVLACDIEEMSLKPFASADANHIPINSPMQCLHWDDATLLVLYSGTGGRDDGLIVAWDISGEAPAVRAQYPLPGLTDPMGFARIPDSHDLVVVDNNWALTEVKAGRLARVTLPNESGEAQVKMLGTALPGPTTCTFGPDGRLYVALLGKAFDQTLGQVIAIAGVR